MTRTPCDPTNLMEFYDSDALLFTRVPPVPFEVPVALAEAAELEHCCNAVPAELSLRSLIARASTPPARRTSARSTHDQREWRRATMHRTRRIQQPQKGARGGLERKSDKKRAEHARKSGYAALLT